MDWFLHAQGQQGAVLGFRRYGMMDSEPVSILVRVVYPILPKALRAGFMFCQGGRWSFFVLARLTSLQSTTSSLRTSGSFYSSGKKACIYAVLVRAFHKNPF